MQQVPQQQQSPFLQRVMSDEDEEAMIGE
ncbi:hypothetical protein A2U01_0074259, partial [Trifolium medium]|nr:hypothetical protein [Trifolium medium]